ncbi:hypothetical protein GWI33_001260 [Rhynchophorus ferrugineus]|uniref:Uncharacterized protein n=1 Tax=Rhynchophorus ferrugineus TaxID=354439 RepID=A0A834HN65_RHYFE|nr:hypothetical protein GWI33_001260 [Rhynchophorus ferrugineus]
MIEFELLALYFGVQCHFILLHIQILDISQGAPECYQTGAEESSIDRFPDRYRPIRRQEKGRNQNLHQATRRVEVLTHGTELIENVYKFIKSDLLPFIFWEQNNCNPTMQDTTLRMFFNEK